MAELNASHKTPTHPDRRAARRPRISLGGIECRLEDSEPTRALHSIAVLFRVMSGLLLLLMAVQIALGVTSTVEISYGVLFGEALRLLIFAGLLWAAGDLSDLFIKSQCDIRMTRILIARLASVVDRLEQKSNRGRDDAAKHL